MRNRSNAKQDAIRLTSRRRLENSSRQARQFRSARGASPAGFSLKWSILYRRSSRGRLTSARPRALLRGLGFKSPYWPRFGGAFFCVGVIARFPSGLSELHFGLRVVATLAPRDAVRISATSLCKSCTGGLGFLYMEAEG